MKIGIGSLWHLPDPAIELIACLRLPSVPALSEMTSAKRKENQTNKVCAASIGLEAG